MFKKPKFTTVSVGATPCAIAPSTAAAPAAPDDEVFLSAIEAAAELDVATPKTLECILPIEIFIVCASLDPIWKTLEL